MRGRDRQHDQPELDDQTLNEIEERSSQGKFADANLDSHFPVSRRAEKQFVVRIGDELSGGGA